MKKKFWFWMVCDQHLDTTTAVTETQRITSKNARLELVKSLLMYQTWVNIYLTRFNI